MALNERLQFVKVETMTPVITKTGAISEHGHIGSDKTDMLDSYRCPNFMPAGTQEKVIVG